MVSLSILSDIHYASAGEQARGDNYEYRDLTNPALRWLLKCYRHYFWARHPLRQNHLLDKFLEDSGAEACAAVIANGDYSCDTGFVGVSDEAAFESARECLGKLRARFGGRFRAVYGDHELGKASFFGKRGGMRLLSWQRARQELDLVPFWRFDLGAYVVFGVVSSLLALPVFAADALPSELEEWRRLRAEHLAEVQAAFSSLGAERRVVLFCHDPTALPFLAQEEAVRTRLSQIDLTVIGHLHSELILWKSRILAGMPPIGFLGHSAKRMSSALHQAAEWRPFHVRLCPALSGIEMLKDGGYCTVELDPEARHPLQFKRHRLGR